MSNAYFSDDRGVADALRAMQRLLEWLRPMPAADRQRLLSAMAAGGDELQQNITHALSVVEDAKSTADDRTTVLRDVSTNLNLPIYQALEGTLEAEFARRLRSLLEARQITQQELAERIGCSQPAISQLLNRSRRPRKETILKIAEVLAIEPQELWPNLPIAELLDDVEDFQQAGYVMTPAEAEALSEMAHCNRPKFVPRVLPIRRNKE